MLKGHDADRAREALFWIPADLPRDLWVKVGMAAHAAGLSYADFDSWSAQADSYNAQSCRATWRSFKSTTGGVTASALFGMARDHGWTEGNVSPRPAPERMPKPVEPPHKPTPGMGAAEIWERCEPATYGHPYIVKKQAAGVSLDNLRVVPVGDPLRIMGESMAGALVVPCTAPDGTLSSLQFIALPDVAARLKAADKPDKLNLLGHPMAGWFTVGELMHGGMAYICEGIGTAWACWKATGAAAVVCFGAGNMGKVAKALRERDPSARLVLVPDVGKEKQAAEIAAAVSGMVAAMPVGWAQNSDVHDLAQRDGMDALEALLLSASEPPVNYPVSVAFADELSDRYEPPDELIEGVLTSGDGSVLYGDSNSGKTFLVIDMAASVARGVNWMGKRTEPGLVVYLAAESPASVRGRLQAYQRHHDCKVPNFAIVQSPIDLFDGDADTDRVIKLVHQLERQRGQKVRLIVGDTLARLSAGANENAGQDMGLVVRRFDRIRTECNAHFLLIHHSGKAAAAGARGWSGIRAAVDTEIEISDSPSGRCVEITKQRDLSTKGERIGFRLDVVTLGQTKWGEPATSCVVAAADAPVKQQGKRMSECDGAVLEFLVAHKVGIKKRDVVTHFEGRYEKGPIYRAMKALVTAAAVHEAAGMVCAAGAVR
ncbi:MAG: AAA family ATPase [Betaproteobacteria bacterium]|nr:AAA family ATPase [Betaproteobacteria bacterium]